MPASRVEIAHHPGHERGLLGIPFSVAGVGAGQPGLDGGVFVSQCRVGAERAGVSATSEHPDFRVSAVQLILALVATTTRGGSVDFRVPLIGMQLRAGATVSRQDTHSLDLMLVPPGLPGPESPTAVLAPSGTGPVSTPPAQRQCPSAARTISGLNQGHAVRVALAVG